MLPPANAAGAAKGTPPFYNSKLVPEFQIARRRRSGGPADRDRPVTGLGLRPARRGAVSAGAVRAMSCPERIPGPRAFASLSRIDPHSDEARFETSKRALRSESIETGELFRR
jgi:hypothetical protein